MSIGLLSETTFYVNAARGNDSLEISGSSTEYPLKTINRALLLAKINDVIIVEGKEKGKEINYNENVVIEKSQIKLIGKNLPILNGNFKSGKTGYKNGISVLADQIEINGFKIVNYNEKFDNFNGFQVAAGIAINDNFQSININNCMIEKCGIGVLITNGQLNSINGCVISDIKGINTESIKSGGVGICIYGNKPNLHAMEIGNKEGNKVLNCENYGIFYGNLESESFCESGAIHGNNISGTKVNSAIYICNTKSLIRVTNNEITENNIGLKITGDNADFWLDENIFSKTISANEIISDEKYSGGVLKAFWSELKNKFDRPTYAILDDEGQTVVANNGIRSIKNNKKLAEDQVKEKQKISTKE